MHNKRPRIPSVRLPRQIIPWDRPDLIEKNTGDGAGGYFHGVMPLENFPEKKVDRRKSIAGRYPPEYGAQCS